MAWMWWTVGLVALGLALWAVVVDLRRPAPGRRVATGPVDPARLAQLDQAIAGAAAHVATLELDGAPVATAGPLHLGTHRVRVGARALELGPELQVSLELDHPAAAPDAGRPAERRAVRGLDGAVIALPPGATVAPTDRGVALLAPVAGRADGPADDRSISITITDPAGDEVRAEIPGDHRAEAAALIALLDGLLDTERAVLDARRGVAVAEAKRTLAALRAGRTALVGSEGPAPVAPSPDHPGSSTPPAAWAVVVAADAERKAELLRRLRDHATIDLRHADALEATATAAEAVVPGEGTDDDVDAPIDLRALGATS